MHVQTTVADPRAKKRVTKREAARAGACVPACRTSRRVTAPTPRSTKNSGYRNAEYQHQVFLRKWFTSRWAGMLTGSSAKRTKTPVRSQSEASRDRSDFM